MNTHVLIPSLCSIFNASRRERIEGEFGSRTLRTRSSSVGIEMPTVVLVLLAKISLSLTTSGDRVSILIPHPNSVRDCKHCRVSL